MGHKRIEHGNRSVVAQVTGGFMARLQSGGRRLMRVIRWTGRLLYWLIGKYTPPPWLLFLLKSPYLLPKGLWVGTRFWFHGNRYSFLIVAPLVVTFIVVGVWHQVRPTQPRVSMTGSAPEPTPVEEGAEPEPMRLVFGSSAARLDRVGKVIEEGVSITPVIGGEWRWKNDRVLIFKPSVDWAVGQSYAVEMTPGLFAPHVLPRSYRHTFRSAAFEANMRPVRFFEDPVAPERKKVVATVQFTHPVNTEDFRNRVRVTLGPDRKKGWFGSDGEPLGFEVRYNPHRTEAYIHSENLTIPEDPMRVRVVVESGALSARGGPSYGESLQRVVKIPARRNFFRIASTKIVLVPNERFEKEQILVVETSAGVETERLKEALRAWVLPEDRPEMQGLPAQEAYPWEDITEIGQEVLALSEAVALAPLPQNVRFPTVHSFRLKVRERRYLYLNIGKSLAAPGGYTLLRDHADIHRVPVFPGEVRIVHKGAVLPLSGERTVSIAARDLPGLIFKVQKVSLDDLHHLVTQARGDFDNPVFVNWEFNADNISESIVEVRPLAKVARGTVQRASFDFSRIVKQRGTRNRGLFFLTVAGYDPKRKRVLRPRDRRMILVTDLGVVVKKATDGTQDIFVQSLAGKGPVAGAEVKVMGTNGRSLRTGLTDARGHLRIGSLKGLRREKTPVAYLVTHGADVAFLPFRGFERELGFSRFDVGGEETPDSGRGLDAFLFSDRGLYRPGDTFHAGIIIKSPDWKTSLQGVPLEAVLTDPRGMELERRRIVLSAAGFEAFDYPTEETSPTGSYTLNLYVVKDGKPAGLLNSVDMRLEEFIPDSMRLSISLSRERTRGWLSPEGLVARVGLKTLFGQPAAGRRVMARLNLSPARVRFPAYKGYRFFDPARAKKIFSERLSPMVTDGEGLAAFTLPLERFAAATYRVTFHGEGFEAQGGRSVRGVRSMLVSPLAHIIGYKPDGDLDYIRKGTSRQVLLIAINSEENPTAVRDLRTELVAWRHVSVLTRQDNDTYKYESVRKETQVSSTPLALPAEALPYALPTDVAGDFELRIMAADGTELNRIPFTVVGPGQLARGLEKEAELQITLEKNDYRPGEEIEMQIRAPYTGSGLITIEREKVHAFKWFRSNASTSVQRIRIPKGMEGNAYVNVTFVRALDSQEIFMNPLSYGVVPFTLSRSARTNPIVLKAPALARPGEPFTVHYRSERPGRIALIAVNEGILQLADYRTPDPLSHFFRKRALEVTTRQILDQLLPDFKVVQALAAVGGDAEMKRLREADLADGFLARNLNPFRRKQIKPVAFWSGIRPVDATEREYTFKVPDHFNGTLRVMAVAVSPGTVGAAQRESLVRGHFVISPNVPTFVSPGDIFEVGVNVFNNIEGSGKDTPVVLKGEASEHLEFIDGNERALKVSQRRDATVVFKVRALKKLGSGRLAFTATWKDKHSTAALETSVRPAQPYLVRVTSGHLEDGKGRLQVTRKLYPRLRTLEASASTLPLGLSQGLLAYLKAFPYRCTEQLVSQAFPTLVLGKRPEFGQAPDQVAESMATVLRILQARQTNEGSFGFWAAHTHVSDLQSVYAMHFLTEAREAGQSIPTRLQRRGLGYLRSLAARKPRNLNHAREQAYGIYILTRNGVVTTNLVDGLRKTLDANDWPWKEDSTGFFLAATHRLLKQEEQAQDLIARARLGGPVRSDTRWFYDRLTRDAQLLFILARHFPERLQDLTPEDIQAFVEPVLKNDYNTLSSAYTILALDAYATAVGMPEAAGVTLIEELHDGKQQTLALPKGLFPKVPFSTWARALAFSAQGNRPLFTQITEGGYDLELPDKEIREGLEVVREYRNLKGEIVTRASLGEKLTVHVRIRALDGRWHSNVALVDLLPGGFGADTASIPVGRGKPVDTNEEETGSDGDESSDGSDRGEDEEVLAVLEANNLPPERIGEALEHFRTMGGVDLSSLRIQQMGGRWIIIARNEEGERVTFMLSGGRRGRSARVPRIARRPPPAFPEYVDIREDRVIVFGAVGEAVQTFTYTIQATNEGRFSIPPPFAESMYDRNVRARGLGGSMEVGAPAEPKPSS